MTPVASLQFDTDQLAPDGRFAAWSSAIPEYTLSLPEDTDPDAFRVQVSAWFLGDLVFTHSRVPAVRMTRSAARIRIDGVDTYNFVIVRSGSWAGRAADRDLVVGPGQLVALDLSRPFELESLPTDGLQIIVGRAALERALRRVPDMHGHVFSGTTADLLVDHLLALFRRLPHMDREDAPSVVRATLAQFSAALDFVRPKETGDSAARALLQRARRHIEQQLTDRSLTPDRLATDLGVSRATLYRSFEPFGGISDYIRQRRLGAVRFIIANPEERRPIGELAELFGFTDAAHLASAFRRTYGVSPREAREGAGNHPLFQDLADDSPRRYRTWNRMLGKG